MDSLEKIKNISIPTLIIHGNSDNIVPFEQGKKLFSASPSKNKYFIELDGWGHNYILSSFANELKGVFINFISS
ncbi:MAG: alpha/beta hydrolase [Candidatus Peribacteria bacterium]|nr:MAG: alpha/beta hydrolase [Candidatus Peribacteria bacterium]